MNESNEPITAALVTRTVFPSGPPGPVSVHVDEAAAYLHLGRALVRDGGAPAGRYAVTPINVYGLVVESHADEVLREEREAFDDYFSRLRTVLDMPKAGMSELISTVRGLLEDSRRAVPSPVESIPESAVVELALAVGWSASDVRGVPGSFARLLREIRDLAQGRALAHGSIGAKLDPEGLERAARAISSTRGEPMDEGDWASLDGREQERLLERAARLIRLYLADPED